MDIAKAISSLERRGFHVRFFNTRGEAADYLCKSLQGTAIGIGGSKTIEILDIYDRLSENNQVFWHAVVPGEGTMAKAAAAPVYISGVNGLSETGELVNIDGRGNRVSSTLYNKEKVIFVTGINKLAPDLESAIFRARNIASPKNAQRLGKNTPCAKNADKCYDCNSKDRICNGLVIHMGRMTGTNSMEVVLIGEELGF